MVNISITGTSSDGYRNVICLAVAGLPRRGGYYYYQLSKENQVSGASVQNDINYST
jgi:hypothetical protein